MDINTLFSMDLEFTTTLLLCTITISISLSNDDNYATITLQGAFSPNHHSGNHGYDLSNESDPNYRNSKDITRHSNHLSDSSYNVTLLDDFVHVRNGLNVYPAGSSLLTIRQHFNPVDKYKDRLKIQESPRKQLKKHVLPRKRKQPVVDNRLHGKTEKEMRLLDKDKEFIRRLRGGDDSITWKQIEAPTVTEPKYPGLKYHLESARLHQLTREVRNHSEIFLRFNCRIVRISICMC